MLLFFISTQTSPFYQAAAETSSLGSYPGGGDVSIFNALSMTALGTGNHEFDGGADEYCRVVQSLSMPVLVANLDFSQLTCSPNITVSPDAQECSSVAGTIAKSCYVEMSNGLTVGLIGRAPEDFFEQVDADTLPGLDFVGGR